MSLATLLAAALAQVRPRKLRYQPPTLSGEKVLFINDSSSQSGFDFQTITGNSTVYDWRVVIGRPDLYTASNPNHYRPAQSGTTVGVTGRAQRRNVLLTGKFRNLVIGAHPSDTVGGKPKMIGGSILRYPDTHASWLTCANSNNSVCADSDKRGSTVRAELTNVSGTFQPGETINASSGGSFKALGINIKVADTTKGTVPYESGTGTLTTGATLTGATSGATATLSVIGGFPGALVAVQSSSESGLAYMEGVLADCNNQNGVDALNFSTNSGVTSIGPLYVQNCICINTVGFAGSFTRHADSVQMVGPMNGIYFDRVTGIGGYQGLQLQAEFAMGDVKLSNCNARYGNPNYLTKFPALFPWSDGSYTPLFPAISKAEGYIGWFGDRAADFASANVLYTLENIYFEQRVNFYGGTWGQFSVSPRLDDPTAPLVVTSSTGKSDHGAWPAWTKMASSSFVQRGNPPFGDFCPRSRIIDETSGVVTYVSPGYV